MANGLSATPAIILLVDDEPPVREVQRRALELRPLGGCPLHTDRAIFGPFRMYGSLFELQVDGSAVGCSRR